MSNEPKEQFIDVQDFPPPSPEAKPCTTCGRRRRRRPQYPSIPAMAGSLAKDGADHLIHGMPEREKAEVDRIWSICEACEHLVKEAGRCEKCGCFMKAKIAWARTHCKIGRW